MSEDARGEGGGKLGLGDEDVVRDGATVKGRQEGDGVHPLCLELCHSYSLLIALSWIG